MQMPNILKNISWIGSNGMSDGPLAPLQCVGCISTVFCGYKACLIVYPGPRFYLKFSMQEASEAYSRFKAKGHV